MPTHVSLFGPDNHFLDDKLFYSLIALFIFVIVSLPDVYEKTNKFMSTFNSDTKCPKSEGKFVHTILFFILLFIATRFYEKYRFGIARNSHIIKYVFYASLIYFALSSSDSYLLSKKIIPIEIASSAGCPNINGILIHGMIFLTIITLVMYFPKDVCNSVESYNNGFDKDCSKNKDEHSCLANPNCGYCVSKNEHGTTSSCVVDNDDKQNHRPLFATCSAYKYGDVTFVYPDTEQGSQPASSQLSLMQLLGLGTIANTSDISAMPAVPISQTPNNVGNSKNENDESVTTNNSVDFSYANDCSSFSGNQSACLQNVNCVVCGDDCTEGDEFGPYSHDADCKGKLMYKRPY